MSRARKYSNCLNTCLNETNPTVFTDEFTAERKALVTQRKKEKANAVLASMPPPLPEGTLPAPPVPRDNTPPLSRLITELIKVYNNQDDIKYGGEDYETLRGKVDIYYDYCHKVRVP